MPSPSFPPCCYPGFARAPGKRHWEICAPFRGRPANGRSDRFGTDVRDWWVIQGAAVTERAEVAWSGVNLKSKIQLYKRTWTNALPEIALQSIDYVSAGAVAAPFLIAITAE